MNELRILDKIEFPMAGDPKATGNVNAARALGRCYGAIFFSSFGGIWMLLGTYAFGLLGKAVTVLVVACTALLVVLAMRLRRRCKEAAEGAFPEEERRRNNRIFGIVNAVTWTSVFLVFLIFPMLGRQDLAFPAVVLLVGLHFFPMPILYRHRANLVLGACMAIWAIICPLFFQGDRMIGFVTTGAGVALWLAAAWALNTAAQLLTNASRGAGSGADSRRTAI